MKGKVSTIMKTVFLTFAVMSLLLVSVPTVSAKVLKFKELIIVGPTEWSPNPGMPDQPPDYVPGRDADWSGPLTGDIKAMSYFWEIMTGPDTYLNYLTGAKGGKVEHFFEDFLIVFDDGGWIAGWNNGIWTFSTSKYRAEGRVTAASPDKQNFIGCKFYEEGIVTFPDPEFKNPPYAIGVGTGHITGKL